MKKNSWFALLLFVFIFISCKKKNNCFVQDADKNTIDTIKCDCYKETIQELEGSPYLKDSTYYSISCQEE